MHGLIWFLIGFFGGLGAFQLMEWAVKKSLRVGADEPAENFMEEAEFGGPGEEGYVYDFDLVLAGKYIGVDFDNLCEDLAHTVDGSPDFSVSSSNGVVTVSYTRNAGSEYRAVQDAIDEVNKAGYAVETVVTADEPDGYMT